MATFTKIADFVESIAEGGHDLGADSLVIALSNTAPASETSNPLNTGNGVLANVTEVSYANLSSRAVTVTSSAESGGTYTLSANNVVLNATGAVATFRYVYIYNDTPTAPADQLIGMWDYGSGVTLGNGDSFTISFAGGNILTLT